MPLDVETLYRRYGPMVHRRCAWILRDDDAGLDVMQETFLAVLRRRDVLVDDKPASLLLRVATNLSLNRLRTLRRHPEDADDALLLSISTLDEVDNRSAARQLLQRLFAPELESTKTIAVLHLVDGLTHEEVAREVGMSVSGVRRRLRVLKARLEQLESLQPSPGAPAVPSAA